MAPFKRVLHGIFHGIFVRIFEDWRFVFGSEMRNMLVFSVSLCESRNRYLEPETSVYKWLFQLDDSQSLYRKWLFHQTSIYKWLFRAPGRNSIISSSKCRNLMCRGSRRNGCWSSKVQVRGLVFFFGESMNILGGEVRSSWGLGWSKMPLWFNLRLLFNYAKVQDSWSMKSITINTISDSKVQALVFSWTHSGTVIHLRQSWFSGGQSWKWQLPGSTN